MKTSYPKFTKKEIEYIYTCICKSDTELFQEKGFPCLSFTPFKNDLANKLNKYKRCLEERSSGLCS